MNRTGSPVKDFAFADQSLRLGIVRLTGIGEPGSDVLVAIEPGKQRFITDGDQQLFLAFFTVFAALKTRTRGVAWPVRDNSGKDLSNR